MSAAPEPADLRAAALEYVDGGIPVMPGFSPSMVASRETLDAIRVSPHPLAHLFCHLLAKLCKQPLRARFLLHPITDRKKAEAWFRKHGNANILLCLGRRSDLLALDVDHPHCAYTLKTRGVSTAQGEHLYFRYPKDFACTRRVTPEGIHFQGDGCWTVAPPSEHAYGKRYAWIRREMAIAPLPEELRQCRFALISQRKIMLALFLMNNLFLSLILFPGLKMSAPWVARLALAKKRGWTHKEANPEMIQWALRYVEQGFAVIPGYSPRMFPKVPIKNTRVRIWYTMTGKVVLRSRFLWRPLRSEAEARACFKRFPLANILIRTGAASGIVVLDVDDYDGGHLALPSLNMPPTRSVTTSGGKHYYFRLPENTRLPTVKDALAPGVTVMAERGQVIAPPSLHAFGAVYQWDNPETPLALFPHHLIARIEGHALQSETYLFYRYYLRKRFFALPILRLLLRWEQFKNTLFRKP